MRFYKIIPRQSMKEKNKKKSDNEEKKDEGYKYLLKESEMVQ